MIGVPAFIAYPMTVDSLVIAGLQAMNPLIVIAGIEAFIEVDFDVAATAATGTNRRGASQKPDAAFKPEIAIGQRAYRTNIDHVA
jgi:hypothetical protein